MKRRAVLQSLLTVPAAVALPIEAAAAPPQPAPAREETPHIPTSVADSAADEVIKTFNRAQFLALRKLGEILMPSAPSTPGASDAGAADFLDFLIGVSPAPRLTLYRNGLDRLNAEAQGRYKKPFAEITAEEATPLLAPLRAPWSYRGPADPFAQFLLAAKNDLMSATTNSREYIAVVSQRRRRAGGVGQYWYRIDD